MGVRERIKDLLSENFKSPNGAFGEKQNKGKMFLRREDAKRKRKERSEASSSKTKKNNNEIEKDLDPKELAKQQRRNLQGDLKLTPLETVINHLVLYVETGKSRHMKNVFELMNDYPKLKRYIREKSKKHLPKYEFKVYALRILTDQEVGDTGHRSDTGMHNWTLSKSMCEKVFKESEDYYIMECKVNPDDVEIYIPAFVDLMEKLILEGVIDEPPLGHNVLRNAKTTQEIVLPADKYHQGYIIEVKP